MWRSPLVLNLLWSPSPFRFLYKTPLLNPPYTHTHAHTHTVTPPPHPFLCQLSPPSAPSSPLPTTSPPTPPIKPLVFVYYWSSGVKTIQRGCLTCFNQAALKRQLSLRRDQAEVLSPRTTVNTAVNTSLVMSLTVSVSQFLFTFFFLFPLFFPLLMLCFLLVAFSPSLHF